MSTQTFDENENENRASSEVVRHVTVSLQRWAFEMFLHTIWAFNVSRDEGLRCCAESINGTLKERMIGKYWTQRITTKIPISKATYLRLGVKRLGVWAAKHEDNPDQMFNSQSHKIGAIITSAIWRLPENLVKMGYAQGPRSRSSGQKKRIDLRVPNGIFIEMMREAEERKISYNGLLHEAIIQTPKLTPLSFGEGNKVMGFNVSEPDLEKLHSFSSIYQLPLRQVMVLLLGSHFFVGQEEGHFIRMEDGTAIELWD